MTQTEFTIDPPHDVAWRKRNGFSPMIKVDGHYVHCRSESDDETITLYAHAPNGIAIRLTIPKQLTERETP